jgi:hypothetical protein
MRAQNLEKWSDIVALEGMLLFAETLDELLFDHTLDSFKAPALNLHISVMEVRSLLAKLNAGRIRVGTLEHALSELEYHLHHDPVTPRPIPSFWLECVDRLKDLKSNPRKLFHQADALLIDVGNQYWLGLKIKIRESVADVHQKEKIIALARAFTAEVELQGFSRRYLYHETGHFFFDPRSRPDSIHSTSQIDSFTRRFDRKPRPRKIVLRCTQDYEKFANRSEAFWITISPNTPEIPNAGQRTQEFLERNDEYPLYAIVENISARDEILARDLGQHQFDLFTDVCRFADHCGNLQYLGYILVGGNKFEYSDVVVPPPNPMTCNSDRGATEVDSLVQRSVEILSGRHFSDRLRAMFRKVLDYHEAALSSKTSENQLLNLWSSLEGFLPPPDEKTARIDYYLSAFVPVLALTYARNIFRYVSTALRTINTKIAGFVEGSNAEGTFDEKATALLTCQEFEKERQELCQLIDFSPLLRNRCYWCYRQFSTTKAISGTLKAHRQRVTWHIKRIYTARNQIVHSADSLPYVGTLVENLHSYLDILIDCVVRVGITSKQFAEIDTLLALFIGHERAHERLLQGDDRACSLTTYRDYLYGPGAPLD